MKKSIYGVRKKDNAPCTYTIPPEQDINIYIMRLTNTVSNITDKTSKDNALLRMENIVSTIQTVLNLNPQ